MRNQTLLLFGAILCLFTIRSSAQNCDAQFTFANSCTTTIQFTSQSTGSNLGYNWTFGDGTPKSSQQNPAHTFPRTGSFEVCLNIFTQGCDDVLCKTITVGADTEDPVFSNCRTAQFTKNADPGKCEAIVSLSAIPVPTATDNCDRSLTYRLSPASNIFPVGETVVSRIATDDAGNSASCDYLVVVVQDREAPVFNCPPNNFTTPLDAGRCYATLTREDLEPSAADNCEVTGVTVTGIPSQNRFPIGITKVTFIARDAAGNRDTCIVNVEVSDNIPPSLICPKDTSITASADSSGATVRFSTPTYADNCSAVTYVCTPASGTFFQIGTTPVTVKATDASGNSTTCTYRVTVVKPAIVCKANFSVLLNPCGEYTFINQSIGAAPLTYLWTFGDGTTSTLKDPTHTYPTFIPYTISLKITDANGCTSTVGVSVENPRNVTIDTLLQNDSCCYALDLQLPEGVFSIQGEILTPDVTFANLQASNNFVLTPGSQQFSLGTSLRPLPIPPIPAGPYDNAVSFCFNNVTTSPQKVVIRYYKKNAVDALELICADTLEFNCKPKTCCDQNKVIATQVSGDPCCFKLSIENYCEKTFKGLCLQGLNGVDFGSSFTTGTGWVKYTFGLNKIVLDAPGVWIPTGTTIQIGEICLDNFSSIPQEVEVVFLDNNYEPTDCKKKVSVQCPVVNHEPRCLIPVKDSVKCKDGVYTYEFTVCNQSVPGFTINYVEFIPAAGYTVTPNVLPIPGGLASGGCTTVPFTVTVSGPNAIAFNNFCFNLAGHDKGPTSTIDPPTECCTDTTKHCIELPKCCTCDDITAIVLPKGNGIADCCYQVEINNQYCEKITKIVGTLSGSPATFDPSAITAQPGWAYNLSGGNKIITYNKFPLGDVPTGISQLPAFCLNNYNPNQTLTLEYYGFVNGVEKVICSKKLMLACPPEPVCDSLVNAKLVCLPNGDYQFSFQVFNNSAFTLNTVTLYPSSPAFIIPPITVTPTLPTNLTPVITIIIPGSKLNTATQFCLKVHIADVQNGIEAFCCTNPNVVCIPVPDCECKCGKWENFLVTLPGAAPVEACGKNFDLVAGQSVPINWDYQCMGDSCEATYIVEITKTVNGVTTTSSYATKDSSLSLTFPQQGKYCYKITPICDGRKCEPCTVCFNVKPKNPDECECDGDGWTPLGIDDLVDEISLETNVSQPINLVCNRPYIAYGDYQCSGDTCAAIYSYTLTGPATNLSESNLTTFSLPLNFTITGTYTLTINVLCGNRICPRVLYFSVACPSECVCDQIPPVEVSAGGTLIATVPCGSPAITMPCPQPGSGYTFTGLMDCAGSGNCGINPDISWSLVHVTNGLVTSGVDNSPPNFSIFIASSFLTIPGLYELTVTKPCAGNPCVCKIQFVVPECADSCTCDETSFDLAYAIGRGPITPVACGDTMPVVCGLAFTFYPGFDCTGPDCPDKPRFDWELKDPKGVPVQLATLDINPGNSSTIFTIPGTYTLTMTGYCGSDTCRCTVYFEVPDCPKPCTCDKTSFDLAYAIGRGPITPVVCGDTMPVVCGNVFSFFPGFDCTGPDCPDTPRVDWMLINPNGGTVQSGNTLAPLIIGPGNSATIFTIPGTYTLTMTGYCGSDTCTCTVYFEVPDCGRDCIDFDHNEMASDWTQINLTSLNITGVPSNPINPPSYPTANVLHIKDGQGGSVAVNNIDFAGNWLDIAEDGCLCFDYMIIYNPAVPLIGNPTAPKIGIYTGTPFINNNDITQVSNSTRATFVGNSNNLLYNGQWSRYCLPLGLCSNGNLPSNSYGTWVISDPSGQLTGAAACTVWNSIITNVTGLIIYADYNSQPSEEVYFDNFCWNCSGDSLTLCDSLMVMLDSISTSKDSCCYTVNIKNNIGSSITKVEAEVITPGWSFNTASLAPGAGFSFCNTPTNQELCITNATHSIPSGVTNDFLEFCLTQLPGTPLPATTQQVVFSWVQELPDGDSIICRDTIVTHCDPPVKADTCLALINPKVACNPEDSTEFTMTFQVTNNTGYPVSFVNLNSITSGFSFAPCVSGAGGSSITLPLIPTLQNGDPSSPLCVKIISTNPITTPTQVCFRMKMIGLEDCCHSPITYCVTLNPCCDPCEDSNIILNQVSTTAGKCCYTADLVNKCDSANFGQVTAEVITPGWSFNTITLLSGYNFCPTDNNQQICVQNSSGNIPTGTTSNFLQFCLTQLPGTPLPASTQVIVFSWYQNLPNGEPLLCRDTVETRCEPIVIPDTCLALIKPEVICNPDNPYEYTLNFQVQNNTGYPVSFVGLNSITSGFSFQDCGGGTLSSSITLATSPSPLPNGNTSDPLCVKIISTTPILTPTQVCFRMKMVGLEDCCHSPIEYCVTLKPCCDPCADNAVIVEPMNVNDAKCCYKLDLVNKCPYRYFTKVETEVITPGVEFGYHAIGGPDAAQWTTPYSSSTLIGWQPILGTIPSGTTLDIIQFCLDNIDQPSEVPQRVVVRWFTKDVNGRDSVACSDTLVFQCPIEVDYKCVAVSDIKVECIPDSSKYQLTFTVTNQSTIPFSADELYLFITSPSGVTLNPSVFTLSPPLDPGDSKTITTCIQTSGTFPIPGGQIIFEPRLSFSGGDTCCYENSPITVKLPPCDTCTCGKFDFIYSISRQPTQTAVCGDTIGAACGFQFGFFGSLKCEGADCPPNPKVDWVLTHPTLGTVHSGNTFPGFSFPPGDIASVFPTPGLYTLTMTGYCGRDTCPCVVYFRVPKCDTCCRDSLAFVDKLNQGFTVAIDAANCKATLTAPQFDSCHWFGSPPYIVDGNPVIQVITDPTDSWMFEFDQSGTYEVCVVVYEGHSLDDLCWGGPMCTKVTINCTKPDTCCKDKTAFDALIAQGFQVAIDECKVTVTTTQFDSCHFATVPDFGDGTPIVKPIISANGMWMHTYTQPGTYIICMDVFEVGSDGTQCWEGKMCDTVKVDCRPGNCDSLDVTIKPDNTQSGTCCWKVDLNNQYSNNINFVEFTVANADFSNVVVSSGGWSTSTNLNTIRLFPTGGLLPEGIYPNILSFCLTNITGIPQIVTANWHVPSPSGATRDTVICPEKFTLDCSVGCTCGVYNDLFFSYERGQKVQAACNTANPIVLDCPPAGYVWSFNGQFACNGNCLTKPDINWELVYTSGLTPTIVTSGNTPATPQFSIPLPNSYFTQAGNYEIRLTTTCGDKRCTCVIKIQVKKCPSSNCECKEDEFEQAVAQGYSILELFPDSCRACVRPRALTDCDEVVWLLNGRIIGTSVGNQDFCYQFPGSGTYVLTMMVIRHDANGNICMGDCWDNKFEQQIIINCSRGLGTSTEEQKINRSFDLHPNPTNENVTLTFKDWTPANGTYLQILDIHGRLMFKESVMENSATHLLKLRELPAGIYLIKIIENNIPVGLGRVVKQQ